MSHLLDFVHMQIIFHLAQLYYEHQKLDYSEELCVKILQLHQNHTAASMVWTLIFQTRCSAVNCKRFDHVCLCVWFYPQLLADTLFWKNQKGEAVEIYSCIMERNPGVME